MSLKELHFVTVALLVLMFLEGVLTMGGAFRFAEYDVFGWVAQTIAVAFAVTTALRVARETED